MLGGSTLGNISQSQVALNTVDIGLAQLAMHSPYETAGAKDTAYLIEAARVLFSSSMEGKGDGNYKLTFS
jgi:aspartyl aminopeptidase